MDSRMLLSACKRVSIAVTSVCNDSSKLYSKSQQTIDEAINMLQSCIDMLNERKHNSASATKSSLDISRSRDATIAEIKQETSCFYQVFRALSYKYDKYSKVRDIASAIHTWFSAVFDKSSSTYKHSSNLKYRKDRIHEWIENIVIGYGKSLRDNKEKQYVDNFLSWVNQSKIEYTLPVDIYRYSTSIQDSDISIEALVIWDILYDESFVKFENFHMKHGFARDTLLSRFSEVCSDSCTILNDYVDYRKHPEILKFLNF